MMDESENLYGYVEGNWLPLEMNVQETSDGYIYTYSYELDGETIDYYTELVG